MITNIKAELQEIGYLVQGFEDDNEKYLVVGKKMGDKAVFLDYKPSMPIGRISFDGSQLVLSYFQDGGTTSKEFPSRESLLSFIQDEYPIGEE